MYRKIHKRFAGALLLFLATFMMVALSPQTVLANHAQCNDGTQVPESLAGGGAGAAASFCADRAGLESGSPSLLCENGNSSNTVEGCKNQGSTHVTNAELAETCSAQATQEDRAECVRTSGASASTTTSSSSQGLTRCTGGVATQNSCKCNGATLNPSNCAILAYLVMFINGLSAIVGILIVLMITIGGIQYATAGPDPAKVVAARQRIINAVLALALFIFMFAFLQWLVPGGIF